MFKLQQKNWMSYPDKVKKNIEIIVTDDCSLHIKAKDHVILDDSVNFRLFEIEEKIKWNWLQCRNIGAKYAKGEWILLTDMDHLVTPAMLTKLLKRTKVLRYNEVYQFGRVKAPDMSRYKHHNDSFFLQKKLFWKAGGYDEDYAGLYGTSGMFRRRLYSHAVRSSIFPNMDLVLYSREVIPDASTTSYARKEGRRKGEIKEVTAWKSQHRRNILIFRLPFHEVTL